MGLENYIGHSVCYKSFGLFLKERTWNPNILTAQQDPINYKKHYPSSICVRHKRDQYNVARLQFFSSQKC